MLGIIAVNKALLLLDVLAVVVPVHVGVCPEVGRKGTHGI